MYGFISHLTAYLNTWIQFVINNKMNNSKLVCIYIFKFLICRDLSKKAKHFQNKQTILLDFIKKFMNLNIQYFS